MALLSRTKGKRGERAVAAMIRARFPHLAEQVRRSIQSREAEESDVTGLPGFWIEVQDARAPTPLAKLEQAERDRDRSLTRKLDLAVAVTHASGARSWQATFRAAWLLSRGGRVHFGTHSVSISDRITIGTIPVTVDFRHFLDLAEDSFLLCAKTTRRTRNGG